MQYCMDLISTENSLPSNIEMLNKETKLFDGYFHKENWQNENDIDNEVYRFYAEQNSVTWDTSASVWSWSAIKWCLQL